jgi:hypothetical protein
MPGRVGRLAVAALLLAFAFPSGAAQADGVSAQSRVYGRYHVRGGTHVVRAYPAPPYFGQGLRYRAPPPLEPPYPCYQPYAYYDPYFGPVVYGAMGPCFPLTLFGAEGW